MLIRIDQDCHEHLTDTEKAVISFLNGNVDKISTMSISDVAEQTFSSPADGVAHDQEMRHLGLCRAALSHLERKQGRA